jgi:hypothetical protein
MNFPKISIPDSLKIALRNASIVFTYTLGTTITIKKTLDFQDFLVASGMFLLTFATELANYYKVKLNQNSDNGNSVKSKKVMRGTIKAFFFGGEYG